MISARACGVAFGVMLPGLILLAAPVGARECDEASPSDMPNARYIVIQNDTVQDQTTGLMWKQCAEGLGGVGCAQGEATTLSWKGALRRGRSSTFAGYSDWRLPDREELLSLLQRRCRGMDIDGVNFPNTPAAQFWSSTPASYYPGSAWRVHFGNGDIDYGTKGDSAYVRLVRDAQACSPVRPGTCLPHENRLYEPHGSVEELGEDTLVEPEE
ncbi:DUF1566 domain-containing protein [Thiocystis violacea]|uniref:Lcl C-terminal domain-containing protein n=1 Tax=Thiocystis violacea TaxID=13725 RepID=UPI00190527F8|nr:DUF1566 domain-containing protein [Thiocystis violacea]MBK1724722.1 hypothetical protein [Thiocystis violacea]